MALTRAENELLLTRAGNADRNIFFGGSGIGVGGQIHYFLSEVPEELVEQEYIDDKDFAGFLDGLDGFE